MRIIFILNWLLLSCSTTLKVPISRFSLPESNGAGAKRLSLDYAAAKKINTGNLPTSETITAETSVESSHTMMISGALSPLNSLDLEYAFGANTPTYLGFKWQLLGADYRQAKAYDYSLAVRAGQAFMVSADRLEAEEVQSAVMRKYVFTGRYNNLEILAGFRATDWLLVYTGYFTNGYSALMEYTVGNREQIRSRGKIKGFHLGAAFATPLWHSALDLSKSKNAFYTNNEETDEIDFGVNVGFVF